MATLAARVTALAQAVAADIKSLTTSVAAKLPLAGGTLSGAINEAAPVTLASAATVNIGAAAANTLTISGTTTITAFDTIAAGARRTLRFSDALTLTYDSTKLILPRAANITTGSGDMADFVSLGSGNWACLDYQRASAASTRADIGAAASGANTDITSISGNAATATKLAAARTLSWTGDVTGSTTYDGSGNSSAAVTLAASGVTSGTYGPIAVNAKGLVTSISAVAAAGANSDITALTGITGAVRIGRSTTLGNGMNYPVQISATSTAGIALARFSADGNGPFMAFGKGRGSSVGAGAVSSGDPLGTFQFLGDTGSAWAVGAQFLGYVDGTPSVSSMPGGLAFLTTPSGSTSASERMRINSSGNVLIGKTTDNGIAQLQVVGALSVTAPLYIGTYTLSTLPSASSYSGYLIQVSNASRGWALCRSNGTSWIDLYTQAAVA